MATQAFDYNSTTSARAFISKSAKGVGEKSLVEDVHRRSKEKNAGFE